MPPRTPPSELLPYLQQITAALGRLAQGEESTDALTGAVDRAVRTAADLARAAERDKRSTTSRKSLKHVIGANLKALRKEADWTQLDLAEAMTALGFEWQRITCTQSELATRRVTVEEVFALAILFAVPVVQMFVPPEDTVIEWPQGDLTRADVTELFVGRGGALGEGGTTWRTAARAAGKPRTRSERRPAVDLWSSRAERLT